MVTPLDNSAQALRVEGLRKAYDDVVAVDGLNLQVHTGECFGLLGPNGAGKTTTIEICEGLLTADSGSVEVLGRHWESDASDLRELLGIQLQDTQLSEKLTVDETLTLFQSFYRDARDVGEVIDQVDLGEKRYSRVGGLSGGQKQRLAVACALVGNPQLLFLDEPTTGLDPISRRQLWDLIAKFQAEGKTIVLTTHYMEEAERLCDRVAIIEQGRIVDVGRPAQLVDRHCPERSVVLVTEDAVAAERFTRIPHVESVTCHDTRYTLRGTGEEFVSDVIECLSENHIHVTDFRTILPSLEDVFLKLSGHSIRD